MAPKKGIHLNTRKTKLLTVTTHNQVHSLYHELNHLLFNKSYPYFVDPNPKSHLVSGTL
jgi:hypothetical protein